MFKGGATSKPMLIQGTICRVSVCCRPPVTYAVRVSWIYRFEAPKPSVVACNAFEPNSTIISSDEIYNLLKKNYYNIKTQT